MSLKEKLEYTLATLRNIHHDLEMEHPYYTKEEIVVLVVTFKYAGLALFGIGFGLGLLV
ncbi:hypothetical protein [Rhizobium phage RHEph15]|uniref:Uncharacterized protein n=2 Tax=Tepoztlanvirus TaxID=3424906 RepID=A0A7S5R9N9_9CAUD|nr:hypothetical protein EVB35_022 [Rhizobium phage RHph_TM34]QIG68299.1 hypothetical protein EVB57_022 [Rhizobium phage RHph_Y1_20]QIG69967.1 hypothetical protein EVB84_023 [Rhizobium phage RHph_Y48]QIG70019.1 hypothetical protein EVB85_023 [Rhizobium phage RHph_Y86]QIG70071.1 hypothetical protein EVB86_023 [Rhizobium phage RHph_Y2_7]QXV74283.1 hypothetical protein [Rhizobium phage RHEph15]QXV74977.1 hypothetical protein [Rhizobium phage RHEph27]